jgi:dTMP kinase
MLRIDPALGRERSRARAQPLDRLEREQDQFFARIAAAYEQLASAEPGRIRTIDAAQTPELVLQAALNAIGDLL